LWRKSRPVVSDEKGIQAHSGLSNGCRASHSQSELLDVGEKGVYSSYTPMHTWPLWAPITVWFRLSGGCLSRATATSPSFIVVWRQSLQGRPIRSELGSASLPEFEQARVPVANTSWLVFLS